MKNITNILNRLIILFINRVELLRSPLLLLMRLWIAQVFFLSGLTKIRDFSSTIYLFENEYAVPIIPPAIATVISTSFELACPVLLVVGLASRMATLPLLAMTAVIQFTYDQNIQHSYWAMLLVAILAFGPGVFSADYFIARKFLNKR